MHNAIGDVAVMNIRRKTKYFHDFVQYEKSSSPFLSLGMFLACS